MTPRNQRPRPGSKPPKKSRDDRTERLRAEILAEAGKHTRADAWAIQRWAISQEARRAPKSVLLVLAVHADAHGFSKIKSKTLADECGCKRRNVWNHIRTLEAAGLLARIERHRTDNQATIANGYWLPFWRDPCAVRCTGPTHSDAQGVMQATAQDPMQAAAPLEQPKGEQADSERPTSEPPFSPSNSKPKVNTDGVGADKEADGDQKGSPRSPAFAGGLEAESAGVPNPSNAPEDPYAEECTGGAPDIGPNPFMKYPGLAEQRDRERRQRARAAA